MPTVRDAVVRLLSDLGMTTMFGNPGSTELPLLRDLPADFRYILGLQESTVVGMADGYAQATGHAAFVNLHSARLHILGTRRLVTPLHVRLRQLGRIDSKQKWFVGKDRSRLLAFWVWRCPVHSCSRCRLASAAVFIQSVSTIPG